MKKNWQPAVVDSGLPVLPPAGDIARK